MNSALALEYVHWIEQQAEELANKAKDFEADTPEKDQELSVMTGEMKSYAKCVTKFLELIESDIASKN